MQFASQYEVGGVCGDASTPGTPADYAARYPAAAMVLTVTDVSPDIRIQVNTSTPGFLTWQSPIDVRVLASTEESTDLLSINADQSRRIRATLTSASTLSFTIVDHFEPKYSVCETTWEGQLTRQ